MLPVTCGVGVAHMIDLHCHILPGIDDGSQDLETSLEMARIAINDGVEAIACTPHVTPGVYNNDADVIRDAISEFRLTLGRQNLKLQLVTGADVHVSPNMVEHLRSGHWPRLAGTQYFLFEPPHHVMPPHMERIVSSLLDEGMVPILTHPERLSWIESHYTTIVALRKAGALMQLTAGSVTGAFGSRAKYWSERMLSEGQVDLMATDAHDTKGRPPVLSRARDHVAARYGDDFAGDLVRNNPKRILLGESVKKHSPMTSAVGKQGSVPSLWRRMSSFAKWQSSDRIGQ